MSPSFGSLRRVAATIAAAAALAGARAQAAPEEIEVYRGDLDAPGAVALETNQNYVFSSQEKPDYIGQQPSEHRYRLSPELSYGLTPDIELGTLAVTTVDRTGAVGVDGLKARIRYIAPHGETGFYWGANLEVGRVDRGQDVDPWSAELRGIFGYEGKRWIVAFNPTLESAIGGPFPEPASLELNSKVGYRVSERLILGFENYNAFGPIRRFEALRDEEQMLYATADARFKRFDVNLGLGRGLNGSSDGWVLKTVIGIPLS